ncbi:MAG TPA: ParB/RepB/Spo0J family partition protein [Candidatus Ruania gallistercoris]|uniref:ParB/RepB/Spo0J family partition protein n=1 Tax=Candidatus Ruania gallistercoris TaxID=2838746 RepID=A0A9D2J4L6_9MICO|nr:ParB/RepB/Spo0J family partition protein [Candidatus Ruania gallistercoris]
MSERRRALGRGLGALIPSGPAGSGGNQRPVDVFFQDRVAQHGPGQDETAQDDATQDQATQDDAVPNKTSQEETAQDRQATDPAATESSTADSAGSPNAVSLSASEALLADLEDASNGAPAAPADPSARPAGVQDSPEEAPVLPASAQSPAEPATTADQDGLRPVPGATFAEIPVAAVHRNAKQPRQVFDDDELNELASSIREVGVLQPVVVRPSGTDADGETTYELIMGERRWRASRIAGQNTVPAIIRNTAEQDMLRDALLENLHRAQLNPLEEAAAYQQLLDDFGCTHDELAVRIARSRPQISNTLRLLKLPPLVQRRVAAGVLSAGHARALLGLTDGAAMERLAQRIVAEGLSVRATEEIVTLGDDPIQPELRRRPRAGAHSAALNDLAARLSDDLDTKVKVNLGQRKGHVTIEFASVHDLNRILGVLVPKDPGVLREQDDDTESEHAPEPEDGTVDAGQ